MGEIIAQHKEFTALNVITIGFLITAILLAAGNRTVGRKSKNVFIACFATLAFVCAFDWVAPLFPTVIAQTIFPPSRAVRPIFIVLCAQMALEAASIFGGFTFYVDASNTYHRGELYGLYILSYSISAVYLCVQSVRAGAIYQSSNKSAVLAILVLLFTGVAIQLLDPTVRTSWPAVSMAVALYFIYYCEMVLTTDALTHLLNRHAFDEFLSAPRLPCTVVIVDVDHFKYVNDTYGHAFGDVCLAAIARRLLKVYGSSGLVYRTGGDEFTVIVTKRPERVEELEERLVEELAQERAREQRLPTVSQGHATAVEGQDVRRTIEAADQSMYATKRANR